MEQIRAVHVDMDGTLMLSEARNRAVIQDLAAEYGVPNDSKLWEGYWAFCGGKAEPKIYEYLLEQGHTGLKGIAPEEFQRRCRQGYKDRADQVEVRPGMLAMLYALKAQGAKIGLVTSSTREDAEINLTKVFGSVAKAEQFFDSIITSDDIEDPSLLKPHEHPYLLSSRNMGVEGNYGQVVLEDSQTGVTSARRAFNDPEKNRIFRFVDFSPNAEEQAGVTNVTTVGEIEASLFGQGQRGSGGAFFAIFRRTVGRAFRI